MHTNNHQIVDYDQVLDEKFGKENSHQRRKSEKEAVSFYLATCKKEHPQF